MQARPAAPRRLLEVGVAALAAAALLGAAPATRILSFAGPYLVYSDQCYECAVNGSARAIQIQLKHSHFNPKRPHERQILSGFINTTTVFDDTWWVKLDLATRSNNQWKEHAFVFKFPLGACSAVRDNMPDLFRLLFSKLGDVARGKGRCVIPGPVSYTFGPEPITYAFPNVPVMPYGYYRATVTTGPSGADSAFCNSCECHIVPKAT